MVQTQIFVFWDSLVCRSKVSKVSAKLSKQFKTSESPFICLFKYLPNECIFLDYLLNSSLILVAKNATFNLFNFCICQTQCHAEQSSSQLTHFNTKYKYKICSYDRTVIIAIFVLLNIHFKCDSQSCKFKSIQMYQPLTHFPLYLAVSKGCAGFGDFPNFATRCFLCFLHENFVKFDS